MRHYTYELLQICNCFVAMSRDDGEKRNFHEFLSKIENFVRNAYSRKIKTYKVTNSHFKLLLKQMPTKMKTSFPMIFFLILFCIGRILLAISVAIFRQSRRSYSIANFTTFN